MRMLSVRRYATAEEVRLAQEFKTLQIAFKMHVRVLGEKRIQPDFVFPKHRVAIFLDGCFWHGCPDHGSLPKANRRWWKDKLTQNHQRDLNCIRVLRAHGWVARRFWTHDNPQQIAARVVRILKHRAREE